MRRLLPVLAVVLVALAGCTTPDEDAVPSDTATPSATTSSGASTATSSGSGTTFPPYEPPAGWTEAPAHPEYPGLHLAARATGNGRDFHVEATAANDGPQTYKVSSICVDPWSEAMRRDGQRVQHEGPRVACAAWGVAPFRPGERLSYSGDWNGTQWSDSGGMGSYSPVPAGDYVWSVGFSVYRGGQPDDMEFDASTTIWVDLPALHVS